MVRGYGNWCGPGWTAGKHMNAEDMSEEDRQVPAVDGLDMACKRHDIGLHDRPWMADEINAKFVKEARQEGVLGATFAAAVAVGGPTNAPLPDQLALGEVTGKKKKMGAFGGAGETAKKQREWIRKVQEKEKEDAVRHQEERNRAARQERVNLRREPAVEEAQNIPLPPDDDDDLMDDIQHNIPQNELFGNLPGQENVNMEGEQPGPEAARAAQPGTTNNGVSKETPITIAQPSYGLQETHTTILPFNFWFSAVGATFDGDLKMQIRMNSIEDIIITQLPTIAQNANWTRGVFNVPYNNTGSRAATAAGPATFPRTIAIGTNTTETPFWASYWKKLYQYYTVLGCEYKIIVRNPQSVVGNNRLLIAKDFDSYSQNEGATGNVTPDVTLAEMLNFRNVTWYHADGENTTGAASGHPTVITGVWRPGMIKRNIVNDGDVKTWTATTGTTGTNIPTLKEIMSLRFYRDGLNHGDTAGLGSQPSANVQVQLKYLVQFKDLKEAARYPYTTNGTTLTNVIPTDVLDTVGA